MALRIARIVTLSRGGLAASALLSPPVTTEVEVIFIPKKLWKFDRHEPLGQSRSGRIEAAACDLFGFCL
jgi:hypothetical protein